MKIDAWVLKELVNTKNPRAFIRISIYYLPGIIKLVHNQRFETLINHNINI